VKREKLLVRQLKRHIHRHNQRYFSDGAHQNAIPEVLSQKDTSWNSVPELFSLASI
jgi:hypothetical protein